MNNISIDGQVFGAPIYRDTEFGRFYILKIKHIDSWAMPIDGKPITEETEYQDVNIRWGSVVIEIFCTGKHADIASKFKVGDHVGVCGRLQGKTRTTKMGNRYMIQIRPSHLWGVNTAIANAQMARAIDLSEQILKGKADPDEPFL